MGMELVTTLLTALRRAMQRFGPYLVVEILLPGGTLVALLLLLLRSGRLRMGGPPAAAFAPFARYAIAARRQPYPIA
jgi:hypothetical protein